MTGRAALPVRIRTFFAMVLAVSSALSVSPAHGTTLLDDPLTDTADGASAIRNVTFGPTGAVFDFLSFDGIDYSPSLVAGEGTIELVIRWNGVASGFILDTRGNFGRAPGDAAMFMRSTGQLFFTIDPNGGNNPCCIPGVTSSTVFNNTLFHCIAVSYGSGGLKLYVDGTLEDSNPTVTASLIRSTITLGDFVDTGPASWGGEIFHIRTSDVQGDVQLPGALTCQFTDPTPVASPTWGAIKVIYR